eukprot:scpid48650/ scgid7680/ 
MGFALPRYRQAVNGSGWKIKFCTRIEHSAHRQRESVQGLVLAITMATVHCHSYNQSYPIFWRAHSGSSTSGCSSDTNLLLSPYSGEKQSSLSLLHWRTACTNRASTRRSSDLGPYVKEYPWTYSTSRFLLEWRISRMDVSGTSAPYSLHNPSSETIRNFLHELSARQIKAKPSMPTLLRSKFTFSRLDDADRMADEKTLPSVQ